MRMEKAGVKRQLIAQDGLGRPARRRLLKRMCSWAWDYPYLHGGRTWKRYRGTQYKAVSITGSRVLHCE